MSFVHLHLHSQYSLLDGSITIEGMVERAKATGMPAVALTDHGNLYGALEFYQEATAYGIKPIIGIEGYLTLGDRREKSAQFHTHHMILLAKNNEGLKNLFRLNTLAHLEGFYYKPRMDMEILKQYSKGLICLSGCLNGVISKQLEEKNMEGAIRYAKQFSDIFGEGNYYLELMENGIPLQKEINQGLLEVAKVTGLPLVATNDCHYLNKEDALSHDVLLCIGTGKKLHEQDRMKFRTQEFYMKSPQEMAALFAYCPEAISNTLDIAQKCEISMDLKSIHMPKFHLEKNETPIEKLKELAFEGLKKRLPHIRLFYEREGKWEETLEQKYWDRLNLELGVIEKTGFPGYFLIVQDFINYAKEHNIPVGPGRGSAAGSLVAFATRITDIDPIPYHLLFERFLNPERISLPDIDVDFCQEGRDQVIQYVNKKYNEGFPTHESRVAQITTFGKMQARAAIRDVGRVLGMSYGDVDRIAKLVPGILNITLKEAFEQEPKFQEEREKNPQVGELLDIALALEGLTRHASVHAAGVVISDEHPLTDHLPLALGQHDEVVTQWDMKGVEKIGLVKFDFLGLKTLTLLKRAIEMVEETKKITIDLMDIDQRDSKVFEMLSKGETQGVFQLESSGMRDLVMRLKPSSFEDIVALVALYRPGPLGSGMVDDFINRKHGKTQVVYELPQLETILKDTYGVILYQEQVMQIASSLASYTLGEADLLRRAMGKKIAEEMDKQEARFLEGCKKNKIPEGKSKKIFDLMAKFAGYGFNKSHSAAYALISYQTAFMKAHYPVEFMAACLSIDRANIDRIVLFVHECKNQGIEVFPPDVNESLQDFSVIGDKIRFGLSAVKNVGGIAVESFVKERKENGPFKDQMDFCKRVDSRVVNKKVLEALIKCGAFDFTKTKRSQMFENLEKIMSIASHSQKDKQTGQESLFGAALGEVKFQYDEMPEWDEKFLLSNEKEALGFYISGHPLGRYENLLSLYSNAKTNTLMDKKSGSTVRLGGLISSLKEITTKKGDRMAFVTLEDLFGKVELIVFPESYKKSSELLKSDQPIFISGTVDVGEEQCKILIEDVVKIEDAGQLFTGSVQLSLNADLLTEEMLGGLKALFAKHTGKSPVVMKLNVQNASEAVLQVSKKYFINPSEEFVLSAKKIIEDRGSIAVG